MTTTIQETVTLPVLGMTCASCQHHVESALQSTSGVQAAHVDLMAHRATVTFDPRLAGETTEETESGGEQHSKDRSALKAGIMIGAGVAAMILAMPLDAHMGSLARAFSPDRVLMHALPWLYEIPHDVIRWALLLPTAFLLVWGGAPVFVSAARSLKHGATNMNSLVSLGTGAAFLYSAFATVMPGGGRQVYFDAVLLILGFLLLGK